MGNLIDLRKIFVKLEAEIFPLCLKKFAPQNLNLMGIVSSAPINNNQFFCKKMKIFPLVKNFGKILQKVKIFHKVNPNKKLKPA